jgi:hypothetical protein
MNNIAIFAAFFNTSFPKEVKKRVETLQAGNIKTLMDSFFSLPRGRGKIDSPFFITSKRVLFGLASLHPIRDPIILAPYLVNYMVHGDDNSAAVQVLNTLWLNANLDDERDGERFCHIAHLFLRQANDLIAYYGLQTGNALLVGVEALADNVAPLLAPTIRVRQKFQANQSFNIMGIRTRPPMQRLPAPAPIPGGSATRLRTPRPSGTNA